MILLLVYKYIILPTNYGHLRKQTLYVCFFFLTQKSELLLDTSMQTSCVGRTGIFFSLPFLSNTILYHFFFFFSFFNGLNKFLEQLLYFGHLIPPLSHKFLPGSLNLCGKSIFFFSHKDLSLSLI